VSSLGTGDRLLCRPSASAPWAFYCPRSPLDRETRVVPPSPRFEEPSPLGEKMEERLKAPSVVSNSLPASADPRGVSASRTRRLSAPDRVTSHSFPVTFGDDSCAPFCSGTGASSGTVCGVTPRLATRSLTAPRDPSVLEDGPTALRVSGTNSVRRAGPPSCDPACAGARSTSSDAFDRLLLPNRFRLRALAPRCAPSICSRLAPRPFALACQPG